MSKIAIFGYPLRFTPQKGFSWDDLRKIFTERSQMAKVTNGIGTLLKISIDSNVNFDTKNYK